MKACAFDLGEKCSALMERQCEACNFYKTKEDLEKGRRATIRKLRELPVATTNHIRHKYYRSKGIG